MFITLTIYKCYVICCLRDFWQSVNNLEKHFAQENQVKVINAYGKFEDPTDEENQKCKLIYEMQYSVNKEKKENKQ